MGLGAGSAAIGTFCNLCCHVRFEIVFSALKLAQNCYLHYNVIVRTPPLVFQRGGEGEGVNSDYLPQRRGESEKLKSEDGSTVFLRSS